MQYLKLINSTSMINVADWIVKIERFEGEIVCAIEAEDWDGLNQLLADRQEALVQLCSLPMQDHEKGSVTNLMLMIQKTDQQFQQIINDRKLALQRQASSLAHDRKAIKAYQAD